MANSMTSLVARFIEMFKKRIYGKTFYCPVCHLELSFHDTDANGNLVCPLCGVVIELHETYGHPLPIVNDVEISRVQPKLRLHPLAAHLPIGLFPFAVLGSLVLLIISIYLKASDAGLQNCNFCSSASPVVSQSTLVFLAIVIVSSLFTFLSGFADWKRRYGGRPYRIITLKLILSGLFTGIGLLVFLLHSLLFSQGMMAMNSLADILVLLLYFILLGTAMVILVTLGHVGGNLVFGK